MLQPIKMELYFDLEGWNIKDGVQNGRQLGFQDLYDLHTWYKHFNFDFLWMFRGSILQTIK